MLYFNLLSCLYILFFIAAGSLAQWDMRFSSTRQTVERKQKFNYTDVVVQRTTCLSVELTAISD